MLHIDKKSYCIKSYLVIKCIEMFYSDKRKKLSSDKEIRIIEEVIELKGVMACFSYFFMGLVVSIHSSNDVESPIQVGAPKLCPVDRKQRSPYPSIGTSPQNLSGRLCSVAVIAASYQQHLRNSEVDITIAISFH